MPIVANPNFNVLTGQRHMSDKEIEADANMRGRASKNARDNTAMVRAGAEGDAKLHGYLHPSQRRGYKWKATAFHLANFPLTFLGFGQFAKYCSRSNAMTTTQKFGLKAVMKDLGQTYLNEIEDRQHHQAKGSKTLGQMAKVWAHLTPAALVVSRTYQDQIWNHDHVATNLEHVNRSLDVLSEPEAILDHVLAAKDPALSAAYYKHLEKEFSTENITFLRWGHQVFDDLEKRARAGYEPTDEDFANIELNTVDAMIACDQYAINASQTQLNLPSDIGNNLRNIRNTTFNGPMAALRAQVETHVRDVHTNHDRLVRLEKSGASHGEIKRARQQVQQAQARLDALRQSAGPLPDGLKVQVTRELFAAHRSIRGLNKDSIERFKKDIRTRMNWASPTKTAQYDGKDKAIRAHANSILSTHISNGDIDSHQGNMIMREALYGPWYNLSNRDKANADVDEVNRLVGFRVEAGIERAKNANTVRKHANETYQQLVDLGVDPKHARTVVNDVLAKCDWNNKLSLADKATKRTAQPAIDQAKEMLKKEADRILQLHFTADDKWEAKRVKGRIASNERHDQHMARWLMGANQAHPPSVEREEDAKREMDAKLARLQPLSDKLPIKPDGGVNEVDSTRLIPGVASHANREFSEKMTLHAELFGNVQEEEEIDENGEIEVAAGRAGAARQSFITDEDDPNYGLQSSMPGDFTRTFYYVDDQPVSDPQGYTGADIDEEKRCKSAFVNAGIPAEDLSKLSAYLHQGMFADVQVAARNKRELNTDAALQEDEVQIGHDESAKDSYFEIKIQNRGNGVYGFEGYADKAAQVMYQSDMPVNMERLDTDVSRHRIALSGQIDLRAEPDNMVTIDEVHQEYVAVPME